MTSEYRKQGQEHHAAKIKKILQAADHHADKLMEEHHESEYHLKPSQIAKIADKEIEVEGKRTKSRMDRKARKKGGRSGKGNVNIVIAQKPDQPAGAMPMAGRMPIAPPPGPPIMPPAASSPMPMPPPGGMPGGAPMPGAATGIPPQMPRKKGGKVEKDQMKYGACSGLGRLEKAAKYGTKP